MNIKNIFAGLFGKSDSATEAFGETAYDSMVFLLRCILENIQELTPVVVRCKTSYGAERKQYVKDARLLGSSLVCQLNSLVATFASYSTEPITKVSTKVPGDVEEWCNEVHWHIVNLLGLCAKHGCDIVACVDAQNAMNALSKLHDVLVDMMNER